MTEPRRKSPAYSRYPKDFLADTQLLTTEQVGAYQLLLDSAWIGLPGLAQGFLPDDDEALARLSRLPLARWRKIGVAVRALFREDGHGSLFHKRLLEELARQTKRSNLASESASRRWDSGPRGELSKRKNPDAVAMRSHSVGNAVKAAAAADEADYEAASGRGEGEREGERSAPVDVEAFVTVVEVLYPLRRRFSADLDEIRAALIEVSAELPDPLDFACRLWVWTQSEDWQEKGGRFVPPAERFVRRGDWRSEPRRPRDPESPGYGDELAAAIASCGLEEAA